MKAWEAKIGMTHGECRIRRIYVGEEWMTFMFHKDGQYVESATYKTDAKVPFEGEGMFDENMYPSTSVYANMTQVGMDFEAFMVDAEGKVIPAWWVLEKQESKGSGREELFADGFAMEATTSPASCHESVVYSVRYGVRRMHTVARQQGGSLSSAVCVPVEEFLDGAGENARLGCMPSLSAYGEAPITVDGREVSWRSAGCHVHYGVGRKWVEKWGAVALVKALDAIGGVAMVSVMGKWDDAGRRKLYGKAGEYRLPEHGLEYRVPSVGMLRHPAVTYLCLDMMRAGLFNGVMGIPWKAKEGEVRRVINEVDVKGARRLLGENVKGLREIVERLYSWRGKDTVEKTVRILVEGGLEETLGTVGEAWWEKWDDPERWVGVCERGL